jgi:deoxycytidine triphosphate deaminase/intein/homing endonuclease
MPIKSDKWIRRMCEEHRMIEPFERGQVREGVISYGLSSYGYDIRVAPEFKVFTNVHNALVDPKNFDDRSFVDIKGPECIIPPNSFALARTAEYFRIPRNVLAICVGKSTYARCFSGDTRVALVDGSAPTLEEMAERHEKGEMFWGYALAEFGRIEVALLDAPRFIDRDALLEITLDNGQAIRATPDHEFVMRDGRRRLAHELREGESLMPLYRELIRGYESVYQPLNGHLWPTHRLADEWNLRHGIYADVPGTHRHHRDHDRRNNNPWNLERMEASEHIRHHNAETYGPEFDPDEHSEAIKAAFVRLSQDPEWRENFSRVQRERARAFQTEDRYAEARAQLLRKRIELWQDEGRKAGARARMHARYSDPAERIRQGERMREAWANDDGSRRARQQEIARQIRLRPEIDATAVRAALDATGSIRGAADLLSCDRSVFKRFPDVLDAFRGLRASGERNHEIVSIRDVPGQHDVFCLTVPEAGNFALDAGVFVGNCGLVVNVTPLEPTWEGYLTLEISNTTPLPAKVYGGEGIAQLLFLEGDEEPEVAYADRKGKYMKQVGVTLPKL